MNKQEYALYEYDIETYLHSVNVRKIFRNFSIYLINEGFISDTDIEKIIDASFYHDIGKLSLPKFILNKPTRLTDEEFEIVKMHTINFKPFLFILDDYENQYISDMCSMHHEHIDGSGYPNCLTGKDIPQYVKMLSICDCYEALTSKRCYRDPFTPDVAVGIMKAEKGHFDEQLFKQFSNSLNLPS